MTFISHFLIILISILDSIFSFCFEPFIRFIGIFGALSLGLHVMDRPNLMCFQLKNKKFMVDLTNKLVLCSVGWFSPTN